MSALRRLTWKQAATAAAIAAALQLWDLFEFFAAGLPSGHDVASPLLSRTLIIVTTVVVVTLATLRADDLIARGAAPMLAYGTAVVAGTAIAAVLQFGAHQALGFPTEYGRPSWSGLALIQPVRTFLEFLLWATAIVVVYASLRRQVLAAARMKAAQLEHARLQRRAAESSLQALQARIDPQVLYETLELARQRYADDAAGGGRLLDGLVAYLRAALPQPQAAGSSLVHELEVARAAVELRQAQCGAGRSRLVVDAAPAALAARMPPMLLALLIDRVFGAGPAAPDLISVDATLAGSVLQIGITAPGWAGRPGPGSSAPDDVLADLRRLCGQLATIESLAGPTQPIRLRLSVPHDTTDRDPG